MAVKQRKQLTNTLPLGDAIQLFVDTLHKRRKLRAVDQLDELNRLADGLKSALNAFEVDVGFSCRFDPTQGLEQAADLSPGSLTAKDMLLYGSANACCGVKKAKPRTLESPQRPKKVKL